MYIYQRYAYGLDFDFYEIMKNIPAVKLSNVLIEFCTHDTQFLWRGSAYQFRVKDTVHIKENPACGHIDSFSPVIKS